MEKWLLIALGGGVGAALRFAIASALNREGAGALPVGTILVNATGCFAMGLLATLFAGPMPLRDDYRLALLAGVLGGYTTYSAFAWETLALVNQGLYARAALNVLLTNALALAGVFAGHRAAVAFAGAAPN